MNPVYYKYMADQRSASHVGATLKELSLFFNKSPKREACLQRMIQENAATSSATKTKLVDLGRTRWIARHDALTAINQLFEVVVSTLEEISGSSTDSWTPESITQASGLLMAIKSFSFIVTMTITSKIMAYTKVSKG